MPCLLEKLITMQIEKEIIDYQDHKKEIDKWVSLKGEKKYLEFVKVFKEKDITITWKKLDDTFRYDKRLLINLFKYLSFFEDYLRAIVWNYSSLTYKKLEKSFLIDVIEEAINTIGTLSIKGFDLELLKINKDYFNYLRNRVSHNKIIIDSEYNGKGYKELIKIFGKTLPGDYQKGFTKDINSCSNGLVLDEKLVVAL